MTWLVVAASPASATATAVADPDAFVCNQPTSFGFEDFADGTNLSAQSFDGVDFTTTGGYTWQVADFATGYYNGKYPSGAYTSQGTHAAWLGTNQGYGQITFANRASTVSLLISSYTPITMEAYNASGTLLEQTPFSRSNIRTGQVDLLKITRNRADIAYVVVHDSGNYFLVDSLCTDASASTPGTDLAVGESATNPVAVDDTQTFDLDVTNSGPLDADGVTVTDSVPQGYTVTSAVPSQGDCPSAGNNVVCNLGTVAVGESASVSVTATAVTAGNWTNTVQVASQDGDVDLSNNSASLTTTINGTRACTISGTPRADVINGTPGDDVICGLAGNDTIKSSGGDDVIVGGPGADTISYAADPGPVTVDLLSDAGTSASGTQDLIDVENMIGSPAADKLGGDDLKNTISGGPGNDLLYGNGASDLVRGNDGDDLVLGGSGENGLDGGPGTDTVRYAYIAGPVNVDLLTGVGTSTITLNDTITGVENLVGSQYGDVLSGDDGPNVIDGAQGNDNLFGHGGDDQISGSAGNDLIAGETGANTLDGGPGTDTVSYGPASDPVAVSLILGSGTGSGISDDLTAFENITGSRQSDVLTGDGTRNVINGGIGDDLLSGKGGNDDLIGGPGVDRASFSGAPTALNVNLTTGRANGEGNDTLTFIEGLIGGVGNDQLVGNNVANTFDGGPGNDAIQGLGGPDTLVGSGANDNLSGGAGDDDLSGGNGNDSLNGGPNTDTCSQGPGTGTILNCEG